MADVDANSLVLYSACVCCFSALYTDVPGLIGCSGKEECLCIEYDVSSNPWFYLFCIHNNLRKQWIITPALFRLHIIYTAEFRFFGFCLCFIFVSCSSAAERMRLLTVQGSHTARMGRFATSRSSAASMRWRCPKSFAKPRPSAYAASSKPPYHLMLTYHWCVPSALLACTRSSVFSRKSASSNEHDEI